MRRVVLLAGLVVLVLGLAGGGLYWWRVARFIESTDDAFVQGDISVVSPKVEGYVARLPVVDNQVVRQGDVLAVIDDRDFRAHVAEAEGAVAGAEAAIANIDSQLALQESEIKRVEASLASGAVELHHAQQDYDRAQSLVKSNWVSRERFDSTEADLHKAEAVLQERQAALVTERSRTAVLTTQRRQAEATLMREEAMLRLARNNLDDTEIRAPIDGVVGNKGVQVGQYVKAGTQLLSIVPLAHVYVVANFKETQLAGMRPGQHVDIKVDAFPGRTLSGRIESFAPASGSQFSLLPAENATGNFTKIVQRVPVRIALPEGGPLAGLLRPGLSVVVSVDTRTGPASGAASGLAAATAP
jgi:membrane fusion protein (multidrug efflux system)